MGPDSEKLDGRYQAPEDAEKIKALKKKLKAEEEEKNFKKALDGRL